MIKGLERLINIWPTYDLSVRTEVSRKSTTKCIHRAQRLFRFILKTATLGINYRDNETLRITIELKITSHAANFIKQNLSFLKMVEALLQRFWIKPLFIWGGLLELNLRYRHGGWVSCRLWWIVSSLSWWPEHTEREPHSLTLFM
jgi:hypothetical protein